ncbi:hypothetical protein TMatcc_001458 [Talaromyces marneffei ATCC 18224]|uniref:Kinetochore protein fta7 n=1 Tax=Talaromyces marneffei (strain ATCC 18224 / CBS 334.59 / QM 7333) TaxID=441960 RepID=B6QGV7_TALMQ|nr:uncharacterized protein EYB26_007311 [Talaromyces marneffei]EEA22613.1 conserved hypothetical protein [Talaromyces marneffei ATCC 18224]KAE8551505.1 hypothetical protein EYB25_005395 [Talaromyces marneffei]QGA19622.1 hypothetical protein EYB26_007311 [Talaromyces marneffei]
MAPKRKRTTNPEDNSDEDTNTARESKRFTWLKPQVRNVSKHTIKSKWSSLPEPVQNKVRELFRSLERPVIVRQRDEKKRIEAQVALGGVVKTLERRLPRMPFPPLTKDAGFDHESVLNEHRVLETQLSTTRNTIDLLKLEIEREEALLAKETKYVEEMEKNAKKAEVERKRQMKNEHPVLRHIDAHSGDANGSSSSVPFVVLDRSKEQTALCEMEPHREIQSIVMQLNGHLNSMQTNIAPFVALREAITEAQAALDFLPLPPD